MKAAVTVTAEDDNETTIRLDCIAAIDERGIYLTGGQYIEVMLWQGAFEAWEDYLRGQQ